MQSTNSFADLFTRAFRSGKITLVERYELMSAVVEEKLNEEEKATVDRMLHALCRGHLQVVNEVPAVG